MKPKESLAYFQSQQGAMLEELLRMVRMESPTTDKPSVDSFTRDVAEQLSDLGMSIEVIPQETRGNHVVARWGGPGPEVLLVGHTDTVWDLGTIEKMPAGVEGDVASGPGIFDMKAGIVIALFALRLLREHNLHHHNLALLLNSDEEMGSVSSRELIEQEAARASCALILEPAGPDRSVKTKRRGVGGFQITVHGRAAHAGVEPEKGINAIEEAAHQILEIQSWNKAGRGVSVNANVLKGGTRANVIADRAFVDVDVRCDTLEDMAWIEERFAMLKPFNPETRLEIAGGIERPPMARSEKIVALFEQAKSIAAEFDYSIREYWTGGGSDGNYTAALGVPTLDGLGAEGAGAHAAHEHILVSSLSLRTNLLYHLIRSRL